MFTTQTFLRTCNRFFRSVLINVNPNSYVVRWSDPVALLRYFVMLAYPFRFSGEYLYPGFYDPASLALMSRVVTLSLICYFKDSTLLLICQTFNVNFSSKYG